jgi:hypothetical protein
LKGAGNPTPELPRFEPNELKKRRMIKFSG